MDIARFRAVVIDTEDARGLAEFYRQLVGLRYRPGDEPPAPGEPDPNGGEWLAMRSPEGVRISFQQVERMPRATWPEGPVPQMLHLDFMVGSADQLQEQHDRALALGATELRDESSFEEPLYVFADPAGHPFCIFVSPDYAEGDADW